MQVRYVGMFDAVLVPAVGLSVARGEVAEVADAVGEGLLRQGAADGAAAGTEWELVQSPARPKRDSERT